MAATATPTIFDPKVLAAGVLGTTLTTTLYTAPAEAGVKVTGIILCCTGATSRKITLDEYDGATAGVLLHAASIPTDGVGFDVLALVGLKDGLMMDSGDLIRGGADAVGTDVSFLIVGAEMKD